MKEIFTGKDSFLMIYLFGTDISGGKNL